jgi:hypothetical protein
MLNSGSQKGVRRRGPFANPFYLLLVFVSTFFVTTALAYWVGPMVLEQSRHDPRLLVENPSTPAMVAWLDKNAPLILSVQIGIMLVLAILAMATDQYFGGKRGEPPVQSRA